MKFILSFQNIHNDNIIYVAINVPRGMSRPCKSKDCIYKSMRYIADNVEVLDAKIFTTLAEARLVIGPNFTIIS